MQNGQTGFYGSGSISKGNRQDRLRSRLEHLDQYDPTDRECDQGEKEDDSIALQPLLHMGSQTVPLWLDGTDDENRSKCRDGGQLGDAYSNQGKICAQLH